MANVSISPTETPGNNLTKTASYPFLEAVLLGLMNGLPWVFVPLGLVGNVTSLLITTKERNRKISTCVYMSALSVVDSLVLFSVLFYRLLIIYGLGDAIQDRLNSVV